MSIFMQILLRNRSWKKEAPSASGQSCGRRRFLLAIQLLPETSPARSFHIATIYYVTMVFTQKSFKLPLPCNAVLHSGPEVWCKRLCSGPADHSAFWPAIFCFLLEIPIHFIFRLHPKYTKSQSSKTPAPVSRSGDSALCERGSLRSIY